MCFVIRPIRRKKWSKVSCWITLFEFIARPIYLRLSDCHWGPRKSVDFWGEEKWRQAKLAASFILQAHFDEGAAAIYYGVHRASATSEIRFI